MTAAHPGAPFDEAGRRRARDRALADVAAGDRLLRHVDGELHARLDLMGAPVAGPRLRIGLLLASPAGHLGMDPAHGPARAHGGVQAVEAMLPFADRSLAEVSGLMTLHGVNDLPGALILIRRALLPGGRALLALPGGGSLAEVRAAFLEADAAHGRGVPPRVGPTLDPGAAGALLQRAGFADPVVEVEQVRLTFPTLAALARAVRAQGDSGWLASRFRGLTTPRRWAAAEARFATGAGQGGAVAVTVELLYLSGRAPATSG